MLFSDESPFEFYTHRTVTTAQVRSVCHRHCEAICQGDGLEHYELRLAYQPSKPCHTGQTVTSDNCVEEVLKRTAASAIRRRTEDGPPIAVKLLSDMSQALFQGRSQLLPLPGLSGGAKLTSLPFGRREYWPGSSTDLSPMENLCAIVQEKIDKMELAKPETTLIESVRSTCCSILEETLDNMMCGMPERKYEDLCG